jgi:cyclic pyranopterin monophosphate synthase
VPLDASQDPIAEPVGALTHIDSSGKARMVDVSQKAWTRRRAIARGRVAGELGPLIGSRPDGSLDLNTILDSARSAGIDAARITAQLIPLCHPLPPSVLDVRFDVRPSGITIEASAEVVAPTGVEMEALTACLFAALAMVELLGVDKAISIEDVVLWEKTGGRSGHWSRAQTLALRGVDAIGVGVHLESVPAQEAHERDAE